MCPVRSVTYVSGRSLGRIGGTLQRSFPDLVEGRVEYSPTVFIEAPLKPWRVPHPLEDCPVQKGVHTLAVDVETHRVYAPEQEENGRPVSRMLVYQALR